MLLVLMLSRVNPALSYVIDLHCSMARVAHSGMTADEVTENIEAAVQTVATKLRMVSPAAQRIVFYLHQGWFSTLRLVQQLLATPNSVITKI